MFTKILLNEQDWLYLSQYLTCLDVSCPVCRVLHEIKYKAVHVNLYNIFVSNYQIVHATLSNSILQIAALCTGTYLVVQYSRNWL